MVQPPSLKSLPRYPVTAPVGAAALAVTAFWWSGRDIDGVTMNARVWEKWELWRALTSTLPHVNVFHLAFNLYWLWALGTLVERVYGHLRLAGIILLLALGSSLAEFALLNGGVGACQELGMVCGHSCGRWNGMIQGSPGPWIARLHKRS